MSENLPGYEFDIEASKLMSSVVPKLNFETMQKILKLDIADLSNNSDLLFFEKIQSEHGPVFLDEKTEVNKILHTSLRRSGTHMLRKIYQNISGVLSGSGNDHVKNSLFEGLFGIGTGDNH